MSNSAQQHVTLEDQDRNQKHNLCKHGILMQLGYFHVQAKPTGRIIAFHANA